MEPIEHPIQALKQRTSECMQTSATQLISFFDATITVEEVLKNVPVYVENGEKIGTSPGHLAAYFAQHGYQTTAYIFDIELFDRSWQGLDSQSVLENLRQRQPHIPANSWLAAYHPILVDGWELYVKSGGQFSFPAIGIKLLYELLQTGPYLVTLSSTYLNGAAKEHYNKQTDHFDPDPLQGRSLTHGVTCAGYRDGKFLIVDPDPPAGIEQHRWIAEDHLLASIMIAQTESDNLLIKIEPK